MNIFDDLAFIKGTGSPIDKLTQISPETAAAIKKINSPLGYLEFLERIGYGEIGDGEFMLYEGPVSFNEIYQKADPQINNNYIIGDDFQGYCIGFDKTTLNIIEVDPNGLSARFVASEFKEFIRNKLAKA